MRRCEHCDKIPVSEQPSSSDMYLNDDYRNRTLTRATPTRHHALGVGVVQNRGAEGHAISRPPSYRTDCDTDESETSLGGPSRNDSREQNLASRSTSRNLHPLTHPNPLPLLAPQLCNNYGSYPTRSVEDFNVANNNVTFKRSEPMICSSCLSKTQFSTSSDVFPLPIEVPETVIDAEAFRRYLTVRRGAIESSSSSSTSSSSANSSSTKAKFKDQNTPPYDPTATRKQRKSRSGSNVTDPTRQLGHEASRRTASLSHAILTLALLTASICQLRFLLTYTQAHAYPVLNYFLIFTSIILEVAAGIGYVMIARCQYNNNQADIIHNYLIFALFFVAVSNVVLAAFAFDDHICGEMKKSENPSSPSSPSDSSGYHQANSMQRADGALDLRYAPLE